jgi:hypothetical protein
VDGKDDDRIRPKTRMASRLALIVIGVLAMTNCAPALRKPADWEALKPQILAAPTVDLCDLWAHPDRHDGQLVRVRALYWTEFESSVVWSLACDYPTLFMAIWVDYDPAFEHLTSRSVRKAREGLRWEHSADVVLVGRFEAKPRDGRTLRGFGHEDLYPHRIVVMSVERLQPIDGLKPSSARED